jgi:integrase
MGVRLDGCPDRKHLSRKTKAELELAVRDLERSRDTGEYAWTEADVALGRWLDHWLDTILPMSARWKTLSTYRSLIRVHVAPALGELKLSALRPETLEQFYAALLRSGHSSHVVHAIHRVLRSSLGEAKRRQRIATNPATLARPPRVETDEVHPLTNDECRSILAVAAEGRNAARWSVAVALGLRQGEALGLAWADVNFEDQTLRVRRSVQRWTWQHGCATGSPDSEPTCGRLRGADCPRRRNGGVRLVEPKTRASRRRRRTFAALTADPLYAASRRDAFPSKNPTFSGSQSSPFDRAALMNASSIEIWA